MKGGYCRVWSDTVVLVHEIEPLGTWETNYNIKYRGKLVKQKCIYKQRVMYMAQFPV